MNRLLHNRALQLLAGALVVWVVSMLSWAADGPAAWSPRSLAPMLTGLFFVGLLGRGWALSATPCPPCP